MLSRVEVFIEDDRQQRAALVLRNVDYVLEAHFTFNGHEDNNSAIRRQAMGLWPGSRTRAVEFCTQFRTYRSDGN